MKTQTKLEAEWQPLIWIEPTMKTKVTNQIIINMTRTETQILYRLCHSIVYNLQQIIQNLQEQ